MNFRMGISILICGCFCACAPDGIGGAAHENRISNSRSRLCGLEEGDYQGPYTAIENQQGGRRNLVLQLAVEEVIAAFGGQDTAIFISANRRYCARGNLVFEFEDNWGTTGRAEVEQLSGGKMQISLSDLGTNGKNYSRNVLGYYPKAPVVLWKLKHTAGAPGQAEL